jgi:hypothetical protein
VLTVMLGCADAPTAINAVTVAPGVAAATIEPVAIFSLTRGGVRPP